MNKASLKQELLSTLYETYTNCSLCPLSAGRTNIVFGRGNPNASLLLLGEGPGRDEDLQGLPFVGRSGKLLSKTLKSLNIDESSIYITNVVKCRPPNNRAPQTSEASICTKLLLNKQLEIIQPKIVCTLGSSALKALTIPSKGITKIRGSLQPYKDIFILPTYHPAYILRNNANLTFFAADLKTAHTVSKQKTD